MLVVYVVADDGTARATWYPDDSNDEYTKYKISGTWYPFYKKNDGDLTKRFIGRNIKQRFKSSQAVCR